MLGLNAFALKFTGRNLTWPGGTCAAISSFLVVNRIIGNAT